MPRNEVLKYLLDIESVIDELEQIVRMSSRDYEKFSTSFLAVRATERDLMIIGEAIVRLIKIEPDLGISGSKHIISLRNIIVHAYDAVDPTTLWRILIKDLPVLKKEIEKLKG